MFHALRIPNVHWGMNNTWTSDHSWISPTTFVGMPSQSVCIYITCDLRRLQPRANTCVQAKLSSATLPQPFNKIMFMFTCWVKVHIDLWGTLPLWLRCSSWLSTLLRQSLHGWLGPTSTRQRLHTLHIRLSESGHTWDFGPRRCTKYEICAQGDLHECKYNSFLKVGRKVTVELCFVGKARGIWAASPHVAWLLTLLRRSLHGWLGSTSTRQRLH